MERIYIPASDKKNEKNPLIEFLILFFRDTAQECKRNTFATGLSIHSEKICLKDPARGRPGDFFIRSQNQVPPLKYNP
jgi:hypothetical protein